MVLPAGVKPQQLFPGVLRIHLFLIFFFVCVCNSELELPVPLFFYIEYQVVIK